jgi:DhnA family fructose-bisphosphate aldolase class Ia
VELPARPDAGQDRRDRARHLRLCRAHGGAARRPYHQGEAADRAISLDAAKKTYEKNPVAGINTLAGRIAHVVQACFNGRRLVVFSGGEAGTTQAMVDMAKGIHQGGGNGSIIGRNTFQRPKAEALALLESIIGVYKG